MFNNYGYKFNKISLDLTNSDIPNVRSEYENKFISLGQTINYADVIKSLPMINNWYNVCRRLYEKMYFSNNSFITLWMH